MRLLSNFWCADPAGAAREVTERFPADARECIRLADEICENRFTFRGHWEMERTHEPAVFARAIVWDQAANGDAEWIYAMNRHSCFVTLGQAWQMTGNAAYPAAFARLVLDWIDRVPLTDRSKATTWRPIEAGIRAENWLRALALFSGSGVPDDSLLQRIQASLCIHAEWLMESHGPFQRLSNWGVLQDHGLFLLGLAFGNASWRDTAVRWLSLQLGSQVMRDGTHWEQSPLYHCEVLHCCLDVILAARRAGYSLPDTILHQTHKMALALAQMVRPDGLLLCQSDSDEVDARDLLALSAHLFSDETLKGYAAAALYKENYWDFADQSAAYERLPARKAGGSAALTDSGNYMLWGGEGKEADFLHFHCGTLGSGHGHADMLHIDLVSRGESVLCDSGRYTYVECPLREQLKGPAAHNTAVVDGKDFTVYQSGWSYWPIADPVKGEHHFTPAVDYVCGGHSGYLQQGVLHRRGILRLGTGLWVVLDSFRCCEPEWFYRYERFFHFGPEGSADIAGNSAVYRGKRCSARLVFPGEGMSFSMSRVPLSREYNRLEEGCRLSVRARREGDAAFSAVIATGPAGCPPQLEAFPIPVTLEISGLAVPPAQASGLQIRLLEDEWTVIVLHAELISEVDLLAANGHSGYGKVLVFGPPCEDGLVLAW